MNNNTNIKERTMRTKETKQEKETRKYYESMGMNYDRLVKEFKDAALKGNK